MTRTMKGTASAIALALMLAAAPLAAQTVLRLDEVAVGELDPAKASDYADSILMFNAYDTLVMAVQGGPGMAPHLASSWVADGSSYTFTLRDDVLFTSGNPLTADDVVFSIQRMQALAQGNSYLFGIVQSAEAVDAHTVKITLSEPNAPFLASLVRLPIIDKVTVMANLAAGDGEMGDWGQAFLSGNSAGTGAYVVVSHNPQAETVFARNPAYFLGVPDAAPDEVRLRYGLEPATVRALMATGEHEISSQWMPPEVMSALAGEGMQFYSETGTGAFFIKLNTTKPPLDDVNCRLALASAFDYETARRITQITPDVATSRPSTGAIPVGMFGANPAEQVLTRDMDAARAHLADCAYNPADYTLELSWVAEVAIEERFALLMQQSFAELGFNSEIVRVPWVLFTERVTSPETTPHVSQVFVTAVTGDPDTLLYPMYHSSAAGTWQSPEYLNDTEVDQLLTDGRTATTDEGRQAAYAALNARLMALAPTIYAYDMNAVFAASPGVSAPAMTDPAAAFGVDALGFSFRLMTMAE